MAKLTQTEVDRAIADSAAATKVRRLLPTLKECQALDPQGTVVGDPKGKWEFRFSRPQDELQSDRLAAKVFEATEPARRAEIERGEELNRRVESEALVRPDGSTVTVPALVAERRAKKSGLRPRINWGRPTSVFRDGAWWHRVQGQWVKDG